MEDLNLPGSIVRVHGLTRKGTEVEVILLPTFVGLLKLFTNSTDWLSVHGKLMFNQYV